MDFSTPSFPVLHDFLELAQTHILGVSYTILPCHPVTSPLLLPSILPSIKVFYNELGFHIRWSKYWNSSFNISPSNEYSGLISFWIDWFELFFSPRDSQESSPAPQFNSVNSSALSLLYDPTLTSIHNYWKQHSFEYVGICWQNNISVF